MAFSFCTSFILVAIYLNALIGQKKFFNKEQDSFLLLFCEHPQSLYFCYTDQQKRVEGSVFSCSVLLEKLAKFWVELFCLYLM